jgi:uncharacterized protein (UPF0248 family)
MKPLHELLNRIRWDREFGDAALAIGYYDRVARKIVVIPLARAEYEHAEDEEFVLTTEEGRKVSIPFHRVRQVFRDGELIWSREGRRTGGEIKKAREQAVSTAAPRRRKAAPKSRRGPRST